MTTTIIIKTNKKYLAKMIVELGISGAKSIKAASKELDNQLNGKTKVITVTKNILQSKEFSDMYQTIKQQL